MRSFFVAYRKNIVWDNEKEEAALHYGFGRLSFGLAVLI